MATRILVAEDHGVVRQCLCSFLEREGFEVVGEATNGHEAIEQTQKVSPDLAIIDLSMPLLNGLEASRQISQRSPRTKVILLTMYTEEHYVIDSLRAGVRGYVLKTQVASDLLQAIQEVMAGSIYLSPRISHAVVDAYLGKFDYPPDPLTPREKEVLQLIAEGKTTKEVAVILEISVKTADSHRTRIMSKLDIHETASLVMYAVRRGVVQP